LFWGDNQKKKRVKQEINRVIQEINIDEINERNDSASMKESDKINMNKDKLKRQRKRHQRRWSKKGFEKWNEN
jgi:hypothetical protein